MDEQQYALLFAATILAARKLHEIGTKSCPAREFAIADAIEKAEAILRRIEERDQANGVPCTVLNCVAVSRH